MRNDAENAKDAKIAALELRIRDLEHALGLGNDKLVATFHLPPQLKKIFGCLLSIPIVSDEMITGRLNIGSEPKVIMQRLRQHMKDWSTKHKEPPIEIQNQRGVGYYLEPEDKARVRALLDKYAGGADLVEFAEQAESTSPGAA